MVLSWNSYILARLTGVARHKRMPAEIPSAGLNASTIFGILRASRNSSPTYSRPEPRRATRVASVPSEAAGFGVSKAPSS